MNVTLFLTNGKTLHFEKVEKVKFNKSHRCLAFDYFGKSTQKARSAVFYLQDLLGYAFDADIEVELEVEE